MADDSRGRPDVTLEPGGDATATAQPFTATRIADMDAAFAGAFLRARAELDVQSFGISILLLQPNSTGYPEHDHIRDHQEEVYLALNGSATLLIDAQPVDLDTETLVRVSWWCRRKVLAGPHGIRLLVIGGRPGHPYLPPPFSELGAPDEARRSGPDAEFVVVPRHAQHHLAPRQNPQLHNSHRRIAALAAECRFSTKPQLSACCSRWRSYCSS
jgi:hypothetical protein